MHFEYNMQGDCRHRPRNVYQQKLRPKIQGASYRSNTQFRLGLTVAAVEFQENVT